jgi:Ankyrin repeats (many copies)
MSFFKKLFGKKDNTSSETELTWINSSDNPWGLKLLDLRPLTQTMLSSSTDPRMAENAISYSRENGSSFFGQKPENNKTIITNISLPIDKALAAGVLFTPNTMEHKWAIYFDGEYIIVVRSWLREVFIIAKTSQKDNVLFIENIIGEFTQNESSTFTTAVLVFLLISHSIGEVVPAPLPKEFENDLKAAGLWAFSTYGNMVHLGVFEDSFISTTTKPLRTHTLLHIAVAKGEIENIEKQVKNGIDLNCLAGDGLAPLHWSIAPETIEPMKKLLELGANPNVITYQGATPIMNAVQSNKIDKLQLLVESGGLVNLKDNRGFTALHRAAEMGHIEIVKYLLDKEADRAIEAENNTALSLAQARGHSEIIALLL